jgi:hypothetical protein
VRTGMPWRGSLLVTVVAIGLTGCLVPASLLPAPSARTPLYGVTINDIGAVGAVVAAESGLPEHPTNRVYFNVAEPAGYYASAVSQLHSVSGIMVELLDSGEAKSVSANAYRTRVQSYVSTLGSSVDTWEIGNEVNGNWTGPYATGAARIAVAYRYVRKVQAHTALTLYANEYAPNNCGDGSSELTPLQYSRQYVPTAVRNGLTYVFESYYPTECENTYPTSAQVASEMQQLHALYPHALLGFGEVGLPRPATKRTLATAEKAMAWAYNLAPGLPYYVGGYFWWYALEDVFTGKALLAGQLASAFRAEATALS